MWRRNKLTIMNGLRSNYCIYGISANRVSQLSTCGLEGNFQSARYPVLVCDSKVVVGRAINCLAKWSP